MATVFGFGGTPEFQPAGAGRRRQSSTKKNLGEILSLGVIPRMLIAQAEPIDEAVPGQPLIDRTDVEQLAPVALHEAAHILLDRVEAIMYRGASAEEVFVDLLAPIARWLGREWEEDRLNFVEVSMGLWRLQEVLRQIAASAPRADQGDGRKSALFAPMPGEQHSFGTAMLQECFTIAGWDAEMAIDASAQSLVQTVAERSFDLFGLTLSCDCPSNRLAGLIRTIRSVSRNPDLCIMIGGRATIEQPSLVALSGANATATSAPAAVKTATRLVESLRVAVSA